MSSYPYKVTDHIKTLIDNDSDGLAGPIALQYIQQEAELKSLERGLGHEDPIGDKRYSPVKGIVHRYPDRVLFKVSHICSAYCRYCFRKDMIGPKLDLGLKEKDIDEALAYIRSHEEIWEVILTGGDPLVLSPRRLKEILDRLAAIKHIEVIRIHSRVPLSDPARITKELCEVFRALSLEKAVYVVLHVNHEKELCKKSLKSFKDMQNSGVILLSQSVLLAGVNDDALILEKLFKTLVRVGVKPYYLHQLDLAPGTDHFYVSIEKGQKIMRELQGNVSGLCLPRYMLDIPGGFGKVPISDCYIKADKTTQHKEGHREGQTEERIEEHIERHYKVCDYKGNTHSYSSPSDT